jgi:hypothetical protein
MKRNILIIFLFILFVGISYYIVLQIESYNMKYYTGKDNGTFAQFESIVIMSCIFYLIVTKKNRFISALTGIGYGILSGISGYLLYFLTDRIIDEIIVIPIYSIIIFIGLFFLTQNNKS